MSAISISEGNSKMGRIMSVSLPPILTCRDDCDCNKICYAKRMTYLRKSVRNAYMRNYRVLQESSHVYWREVEASIMMSRFFRFHVAGDIPNARYLTKMIMIAERNPHCQILCFTKKYDIVVNVLREIQLPDNLHLILSGWKGLKMDNPFHLPEAHVRYRDGTTTANANAKECGGNCTDCAITDQGCWVLKNGEQIIFDEH